MKIVLRPGLLNLADIRLLTKESTEICLDATADRPIQQSQQLINALIAQGEIVYGINTGFGALADTRIASQDLEKLQRRILLSHARCG